MVGAIIALLESKNRTAVKRGINTNPNTKKKQINSKKAQKIATPTTGGAVEDQKPSTSA